MRRQHAEESLTYFVDEIIVVRTCHELISEIGDTGQSSSMWNGHNHFLSIVLNSLYTKMMLSLSRFFDTQKDSRRFSSLVVDTHNSNIMAEHGRLSKIWSDHYEKFRNDQIAHLDRSSKKATPESMVAMSMINMKHLMGPEFKKFCDDVHNLLSRVYGHYHDEDHSWGPFPARPELQHIRRVMEIDREEQLARIRDIIDK